MIRLASRKKVDLFQSMFCHPSSQLLRIIHWHSYRCNCIQRAQAYITMVWMNLVWPPGIKCEEYVWLHTAYCMYQFPTQNQIDLYLTIVITEKCHLAYPQYFGSMPLFIFSDLP